MRTHKQIITDAGGPPALALLIAPDLGGDSEVIRKRVWAWFNSGSVPGEYWPLLARKRVANITELSGAAEARKLPSLAASRKPTQQGRAA